MIRGPSGDWFDGSGGDGTNPFGSVPPTPNPGNSIGGTCSSTQYTFPPSLSEGLFLCMYHCVGTAATIVLPSVSVTPSSMSVPSVLSDGTTPFWTAPQPGLAGTTNFIYVFAVRILRQPTAAGGNMIVLSGATLPTSQTVSSFYVQKINGSFLPTLEEALEGEAVPMPAPQWDLGTADTEKQIEYLRQKLKLLELQKQVKEFDIVTPQ